MKQPKNNEGNKFGFNPFWDMLRFSSAIYFAAFSEHFVFQSKP